MDTPRKIAQYVRTSLSSVGSLFSPSSPDITVEPVDGLSDGLGADDTVVIGRAEYEEMQCRLSERAETIKRLRSNEDEHLSRIQEYEAMFTEVLKKEILGARGSLLKEDGPEAEPLQRRHEDEISRLRSSEDRLKTHIHALRRDLIAAERAAEETEDRLKCELYMQHEAAERLAGRLEAVERERNELARQNESLRAALKKCEEAAEHHGRPAGSAM